MLNCPSADLGARPEAKFAKEVADAGVNGAIDLPDLWRDLAVGVALGDEQRHLVLPPAHGYGSGPGHGNGHPVRR